MLKVQPWKCGGVELWRRGIVEAWKCGSVERGIVEELNS